MKAGASVTPAIRLVRCLGVGGMGSVWVADHQALRTQVVVKFMAVELAASPDAVERFAREAAAAAQVKSPHVVQMLDHGVTADGVPFIVMELLEGRDLSHYLVERGRLSLAETADIVGQIVKALSRAHERGIVHRDIKPENIFLCDVGGTEAFVKLLDFGIAKGGGVNALSGGTRTGAMIGTPYYMSPEQLMGSKLLDPRTDLWSLGVVVYQCVLGRRPFDAETVGALAVLIHSGSLPQPTVLDPTIPRAFDDWFARACARNPDARFATARELGEALHTVARGEPWVPGPSASPPVQPLLAARTDPNRTSTHTGVGLVSGRTPAGPKSWVVGLSIGAGAVVLAMTVGGAWLAKKAPTPAASPLLAPTVAAPAVAAPTVAAPTVAEPVAVLPAVTSPSSVASVVEGTSPPPASAAPHRPPSIAPASPNRRPVPTAAPAPTTKNEKDIF